MALFHLFLILINIKLIISSCPHGAFEGMDSNTCYKFYALGTDFFSAEGNCQGINGHLASISGAFLNGMLDSTLKEILIDPQTPVWLGGYLNNQWVWTDGSTFSYNNWGKGEPETEKNYIAINPQDGKWYTHDSSDPLSYICEVPATNNPNPTASCPALSCPTKNPSPLLACDPGWVYSNISNACYKMLYNYNWTDAENICVQNGAHLASIHNLQENTFIAEFAKSGITFTSCLGCVWVGLNDRAQTGHWAWSDGTPYDYQNWAPNNPNLNADDCVLIDTDPLQGAADYFQRWDTYPCNTVVRGAICQKSANL